MFRSLFRERQNRVIALTGIALSLSIVLIAIVTLCLSLEDHRRHLYEREVSIIGRLVSLGVITHGDVPKILSEEGSEDFFFLRSGAGVIKTFRLHRRTAR